MTPHEMAQAIDDLTVDERHDWDTYLSGWLVGELRQSDGATDVATVVGRALESFLRMVRPVSA